MQTWYKEKNGRVNDVCQTSDNKKPTGDDWKKSPNNNLYQHSGILLSWFDKNMNLMTDDVLVKKGLREDHRGEYFNIENPSDVEYVMELDKEPSENRTKEKPIENESFQKFDKAKNKWVVDTVRKERFEKESEYNAVSIKIKNTEEQLIRPLRSIQRNHSAFEKFTSARSETEKKKVLEEIGKTIYSDFERFTELDDLIEKELRPELNKIGVELKASA